MSIYCYSLLISPWKVDNFQLPPRSPRLKVTKVIMECLGLEPPQHRRIKPAHNESYRPNMTYPIISSYM
jgi:hypothetical protein